VKPSSPRAELHDEPGKLARTRGWAGGGQFNPSRLVSCGPERSLGRLQTVIGPGRTPRPRGAPAAIATTSLELAAYLVVTGHRLVQITGPRNRRRVGFEAVSQEDRLAYYNGAPAPARHLFEAPALAPPRAHEPLGLSAMMSQSRADLRPHTARIQ
jgi:hypothetical protein